MLLMHAFCSLTLMSATAVLTSKMTEHKKSVQVRELVESLIGFCAAGHAALPVSKCHWPGADRQPVSRRLACNRRPD